MRATPMLGRWLTLEALVFITIVARGCLAVPQREELEQQANVLRQLAEEQRDSYEVHLQLATVLHLLDHQNPNGGKRIPEAEAAYRHALRLAWSPEAKMEIWGSLGALLMSAGKFDDALQAIDSCLNLAKTAGLERTAQYAGAFFNRGKLFNMLGRQAEAAKLFEEAVEVSRGIDPGTFAKSYASIKNHSDGQVAEMEEAVEFAKRSKRRGKVKKNNDNADVEWLRNMGPQDRSWLHFALFDAYQTRTQYDKAWKHLMKANALQRPGNDYDPKQEERLLSVLRVAFLNDSPYSLLLRGVAGRRDASPIFIVGMPRSGSTLLEQVLASHPAVWGAGEDTALAPLLPELLPLLEGGAPLQEQFQAIAGLADRYLAEMRARVPASRPGPLPVRIVDKMLHNAWNLGFIQVLLPEACLLHAVRHPMDVLLSCFAQPFEGRGTPWAWSLHDIAAHLRLTHEVMALWEAALPAGRILRAPYEQVVADQEGVSRQLLARCGLPWDPAVLRFNESTRPVQTASLAQVRKGLYTTAVGKWRRYEKQLKDVHELLKPLIDDYEKRLKQPFATTDGAKDEL